MQLKIQEKIVEKAEKKNTLKVASVVPFRQHKGKHRHSSHWYILLSLSFLAFNLTYLLTYSMVQDII
jgi:hypothetical protein